ncbi:acetoacetyl-CoA synthetase isoform X2 [Eurytemora carolleeae]|uniref:acetoacetyl-CoA synthetase isoform X2 n=1 Tax=Eurytemora carolleeae TaxID=1294199 RepID=UPI000C79006D|nr:acetoacetyl-CoA synthetase isoform X2 [Eurytemora carolleeae]|eukprot:XP_023339584.1 acetoacetyl-CoA synthetase-like isoform X2 [Eurytemora affinis]
MKTHDHLGKLTQVINQLKQVEKVVIIPFVHREVEIDKSGVRNSMFLDEFLDLGLNQDGTVPQLQYEQVPFNHPLFIMYSSGTTGAPKCMVHSVGGTLLKHLEEHIVQGNRSTEDTLMYYTTTGWMMWNWEVTALAAGCSLVLYDGSPLHPHTAVMWDIVDECGVTVFGTSAKWIAVQEERHLQPRTSHSLKTLKAICSTGSPLVPHSYDYVYREIKADVLLASISGGTDIIACFMGENSVLPVFKGEIQSPHLGCSIQAWDDLGERVEGVSGELVCTVPFPSMPTRFWNDEDGAKYHSAYFDKFPGVWSHGDYIYINPKTKGFLMLGRSDGTLNPSGVRFGSAEIYNIVEQFPEISDSLCVGQRSPDGLEERVLLFLKLQVPLGPVLVDKLRKTIRSQLSARHVPALILQIEDIPYTINGKKVELAVKKVLAGQKEQDMKSDC